MVPLQRTAMMLPVTLRSARSAASFPLLLALAALCVAPFARARGGDEELATAAPSPLLAALEAVRTADVCADIHFLASDELGGRYTPSPGLRVAARYIRARLQRLGFEPGAGESFFHTYPLQRSSLDEAASGVEVESPAGDFRLRLGVDYFSREPATWEDADLGGPIVFVGEGSEKELEGLELADAWALVLDPGNASRRAGSRARSTGAIGTIYVPAADFSGETYAERMRPALERARGETYRYTGGGESGSPRMRSSAQLFLTREAGLKLLALAPGRPEGVELADWKPAIGTRIPAKLVEQKRRAGGDGELLVENVCGLWRGSDPELAKEVILISAHYDHMGSQGGEVMNGADDNGSGTTGLLAVAEALRAAGPLRRSVMLIWVSGEERGLWGSRAWVSTGKLPEGMKAVANLNIDMISRNAPGELYITPSEKHERHNGIVRRAHQLAPLEGFPQLGSADEFYHRSDQASFAMLDIPVAFLFSGLHEDYHKTTDDPEKSDCDKIRRVARLVVRLVGELQADVLDL